MELRHLRYFIAVAEEENVSRAALKLHVSQPALSKQVRDLEDELGFDLLERSAKSVRLTEAGRTFLEEARAIISRVEEGVKTARQVATGAGELHVGYAPSLTARILPGTLRAFQREQPKVRVKLHDLSTEAMLIGLRSGRLHLVFMVKSSSSMMRGLQFQGLMREELVLAVARKHPFATRGTVTIEELAEQPLVSYSRSDYPEAHEFLVRTFEAVKRKPRIAGEHESVSSLIAAVEAEVGAALVATSISCTAGPRLKLVRLEPAPAPLIIGLAWRERNLSATAEEFKRCAEEAAAELNLDKRSRTKN